MHSLELQLISHSEKLCYARFVRNVLIIQPAITHVAVKCCITYFLSFYFETLNKGLILVNNLSRSPAIHCFKACKESYILQSENFYTNLPAEFIPT